ncbi:MAG TPA: YdcH family protein [Alphaproteobacteria bacterium]|nr:YdcH family protein [Alphaproteobacteria bacterium]
MHVESRIAALKQKHVSLDKQIRGEDNRPRPDDATIKRLKQMKLQVKDEIDRLSRSPV